MSYPQLQTCTDRQLYNYPALYPVWSDRRTQLLSDNFYPKAWYPKQPTYEQERLVKRWPNFSNMNNDANLYWVFQNSPGTHAYNMVPGRWRGGPFDSMTFRNK